MQKKLTITVDEAIYYKLHSVIGNRKISKFIENLVRPYVSDNELTLSYRQMAVDKVQEQEADEWVEGLVSDDFN